MTHLIAALPWSPLFQGLLNGIGWVLAKIYDLVPNYGVAIILLTILIRVVLLPLGVKQIKSMQAMQAIQPKVKEIQKKYKSNKQKINEETMKLYAETGVNPLGSILPVLLQFPILISMYAVIRPPQVIPMSTDGTPYYEIHNNHLPVDSALFHNVVSHEGTDFLLMNLQCSASQAGTSVILRDSQKEPIQADKPLVVDGRTSQPLQDVSAELAAALDGEAVASAAASILSDPARLEAMATASARATTASRTTWFKRRRASVRARVRRAGRRGRPRRSGSHATPRASPPAEPRLCPRPSPICRANSPPLASPRSMTASRSGSAAW